MPSLLTVNVVEYASGAVQQVISFTDDKKGNLEAENMFTSLALVNGMAKKDAVDCICDGIFEEGDYQVFLVHSTYEGK